MALIELNLRSTSSQRSYSRDLLEKELERDEGKRNKLYKDTVGKWTIGIGHNIDDKGLSDRAISLIFGEDIDEVERGLDRLMPWWRTLSDARQRAILNMGFNMGVGALAGTPTFDLIRQGRYQEAAARLRNWKWARQVGQRAYRVIRMIENG